MTKRRKLIIGNWKMNGRLTSGLTLAKDLVDKASVQKPLPFDVVICPPATLLWPVAETVMGSPVMLGGQDCHHANHGAYTGDISAGMLADLGCRYVILGHSERRWGHGETSASVMRKVTAAMLAGLSAIVCVGETQEQRSGGSRDTVIEQQLLESLPDKYQTSNLVIAYEPVWAIGSGEQPDIEDIQHVHKLIRRTLGPSGEVVRIAYGGSVAPQNAESILAEPEVDGVLVGSASLNSDGFWSIAEKARD